MSVYTTVSPSDLEQLLGHYSIGHALTFEAIASGIENTNYFLTTDQGAYVLTLFERIPAADLPFYLTLMAHLAGGGLPVPLPQRTTNGELFTHCCEKPGAIVTRLTGSPNMQPGIKHCAAIGDMQARMHVLGQSAPLTLANRRGALWREDAARAVKPFLNVQQAELLDSEMAAQHETLAAWDRLPSGAIHGDLFRDNVMFEGEAVQGVIDFGFAATDALIYDLAITVNDWCRAPDGSLDCIKAQALCAAYAKRRPLQDSEHVFWPMALRIAAMRFWLSRLYDFYLPRPGDLVHAHNPQEFENVVRDRCSKNYPDFFV